MPATAIDRQCGSSQRAAHFAAQGVMARAYDIVIAAGVESMAGVYVAGQREPSAAYGPRFRERYDLPADLLIDQGACRESWSPSGGSSGARSSTSSPSPPTGAGPPATEEGQFADEILPVRAEREGGAVARHGRRGHPPRHEPRGARGPAAGLPRGRAPDGRQLLADQRRRGGAAHRVRVGGVPSRPAAAGALPLLRAGRGGPDRGLSRADPERARCSPRPASRWPTSTSSR